MAGPTRHRFRQLAETGQPALKSSPEGRPGTFVAKHAIPHQNSTATNRPTRRMSDNAPARAPYTC
jgi:hypothetical protein